MDWDDKPGHPWVVIPVRLWMSHHCFGLAGAPFGQTTAKRTGMMTNLGFPGLSSQSVAGFLGPFLPENPKTDWDDKPVLPKVVIPVHFGETDWDDKLPRVVTPFRFRVIWPFSARKPRNGLG